MTVPKEMLTLMNYTVVCKFMKFEEVDSLEESFFDIKGHWAKKSIQELAEINIVSGYEDRSFRICL